MLYLHIYVSLPGIQSRLPWYKQPYLIRPTPEQKSILISADIPIGTM